MHEIPVDRLWTVADAATYLQVPTSAVYKMTARKTRIRIPHVRIAGRLRFRKEELDEWLGLLTVSNLDTLRRMHRSLRRTTDGDHPQAEDG